MVIRDDKCRFSVTVDQRAMDQLKQLKKIHDLQTSKIIEIALDKMYHGTKLYPRHIMEKYDKPYKQNQKELFKELYDMDPVDDEPFDKY